MKESNGFTFSTLSSKVVELIMANPAHPFKKESKITKFMNENTNIKLGADGTTMEMHVME